jgi:hypothetical protein
MGVPSLAAEKKFWPSRLETGEMNMQNVCIFIFREGFTENTLGVSGMNMQHSQWSLASGSSVAVEQRRR